MAGGGHRRRRTAPQMSQVKAEALKTLRERGVEVDDSADIHELAEKLRTLRIKLGI